MPISDADIEYIHSIIQPLIGMKLWSVFRKFGSYLYFDFGKLKVTKWGDTGELRLIILDCGWRIETQDSVLTGSEDVHPIIDECVKQLEDQTIVSFTVTKPCLDTAITFGNGLTLKLFPDNNTKTHWFFSDANYTLRIQNGASFRYYDHNEGFLPRPPFSEVTTPISKFDIESVQSLLAALVGTKVSGVRLGYMENTVLSFKEKGTKAVWELMLLNLDWRLETDTEFIAGSRGEYRNYKQLNEHLKNRRLIGVEITRPAFETTFIFKDNLKLRLFTFNRQRGVHYDLEMPDKRTLHVGPGTQWSIKEA